MDKYWFVLYIRGKCEQKAYDDLVYRGFECYLPKHHIIRNWKDRKKKLFLPLFSNYLFVRATKRSIFETLSSFYVVSLLRFNGEYAVVREEEIFSMKRIVDSGGELLTHSSNPIGSHVEISSGPLSGLKGKVIQYKGKNRLLIRLKSIRNSFSLSLSDCDVKPVKINHHHS